jgi:hypothetical protein
MHAAVSDAIANAPHREPAQGANQGVLKNIERRLLWLSTLMIHLRQQRPSKSR